ncbi:hypothetical protein [Butyrivibrio sp.]|uniref:hypothetical protein n=1 Tax=Butyrivibrio sp. TaxID=28121 RepID=UPI0025C6F06F|nr:hypothetical protein [Butyrivibrio sp.]MBQ7430231.1 hypothetical protein [Butyrivibrio sp.]MBQ9303405.1 hypothetical protein [Butyrivibrio sp.]
MKYPFTIASIGRPDITLAAHLKLYPCDQNDYANGVEPLTLWKRYSCLKLNFANSKKKTGGDGNIELNKLDDVWLRTQAVLPMLVAKPAKENALLKPLNYVPGTYGPMKDKSSIQIARELNFAQTSDLANQMKANGGKYAARNAAVAEVLLNAAYLAEAERQGFLKNLDTPDNRRQFLATQSANPNYGWFQYLVDMLDKHPEYLQIQDSTADQDIIIYEAQMKTPHTAHVDANGRTAVYSLSVTANTSNPMPFQVTLATGTGIPAKDQSGNIKAIGIQSGSFNKIETFSLRLKSDEWINMISTAIKLRDAYAATLIGPAMQNAQYFEQQERQQRQQAAMQPQMSQAYPQGYAQ